MEDWVLMKMVAFFGPENVNSLHRDGLLLRPLVNGAELMESIRGAQDYVKTETGISIILAEKKKP